METHKAIVVYGCKYFKIRLDRYNFFTGDMLLDYSTQFL